MKGHEERHLGEKEIHEGARRTTKGHEGPRRATKGLEKAQEGSAKGREGGKGFPGKGKKISTKGHEERRRAAKGLEKAQEGSAKGRARGSAKGLQGVGKDSKGVREGPRRKTLRGEPFAKFVRKRDLLSGRVVVPGSAGVPPAQDLAGSWRLASQGWSVHPPTGAGAAP